MNKTNVKRQIYLNKSSDKQSKNRKIVKMCSVYRNVNRYFLRINENKLHTKVFKKNGNPEILK